MPTKYELQAELRELNRGFPRVPISKMKYHELEAMIDGIRKAKGESLEALPTKTPIRPGQYPPRPIPSESIEDDDVVLHVPQKPAERIVKPPKKSEDTVKQSSLPEAKKLLKIKVMKDDEEPASLAAPRRSEKKTVHFCNCPDCKFRA